MSFMSAKRRHVAYTNRQTVKKPTPHLKTPKIVVF